MGDLFDLKEAIGVTVVGGLITAGLWYVYLNFLLIPSLDMSIITVSGFIHLLGSITGLILVGEFTWGYLAAVYDEIDKWRAERRSRKWLESSEKKEETEPEKKEKKSDKQKLKEAVDFFKQFLGKRIVDIAFEEWDIGSWKTSKDHLVTGQDISEASVYLVLDDGTALKIECPKGTTIKKRTRDDVPFFVLKLSEENKEVVIDA